MSGWRARLDVNVQGVGFGLFINGAGRLGCCLRVGGSGLYIIGYSCFVVCCLRVRGSGLIINGAGRFVVCCLRVGGSGLFRIGDSRFVVC